ncbi:hypothetical protein DXA70_06165 [Faecalibacterium sp. OF04-11AC]|nr:hypothetical protein DXA70_06165 [Faecalibacterium sp. OF04-11AC]
MSRKATCLDNAVAENFFGLLKTELFYLEKFDSVEQLEKAIVEYIDYYNNCRIKLKLNGLSLCNTGFRPFRLLDFKFCLTFGVHFKTAMAVFYFTLLSAAYPAASYPQSLR